ncbi:MAG: putative conjugal transfer protein TrbI family protein [Firmicutes bacterium]|nr:putative conjugal transfer protein TrbI family protein [Bacillota bacterium]
MNLKKDLMTFIHKQRAASKTEVGNVSMKDGDHGAIFGVNRKIVIGTGILFLTVFVLAFIFASDDGSKKQNAQQTKVKQEVADPNIKESRNLPNGYDDLIRADKATATKKNNSTQTTITTTTPQIPRTSTMQPSSYSQNQSYSQPYTLPYNNTAYAIPQGQQAAVQAQQSMSNENMSKTESMKERFKSAIAFALGNSDISSNEKSVQNTATQSVASQPVSNISYTAPDASGLQSGTLIPAILCSGINTDVGGQVVAQVSADIYDSVYGNTLLIPAGSRLLGNYETGKASTDGRVSVTFTTLILPNGGSYSLQDSMVAVDGAGYVGISGRVNNHTGRTLGAGALSTALAAVAGVASGNTSSTTTSYSTGQLAAQGAMSNLLNTASSLFQKGMNTQATVTVDPGYEFNVYVTKSLSFSIN